MWILRLSTGSQLQKQCNAKSCWRLWRIVNRVCDASSFRFERIGSHWISIARATPLHSFFRFLFISYERNDRQFDSLVGFPQRYFWKESFESREPGRLSWETNERITLYVYRCNIILNLCSTMGQDGVTKHSYRAVQRTVFLRLNDVASNKFPSKMCFVRQLELSFDFIFSPLYHSLYLSDRQFVPRASWTWRCLSNLSKFDENMFRKRNTRVKFVCNL